MTRLAIPVFPLPDGEPSPRQQLIATLARIDGWGQGAWREIHATWRLRGGTLVIDDLEAGVSRDPDDRVVAATLVLERHGLGAAREHDDATCDWVLRLLWRSLMPRLRLTATCHQPAASIRSVNARVSTPAIPATPWPRSQASNPWVDRQFAGSEISCFSTSPLAAMLPASKSSRLVPTLPICGNVKVIICPA